MKLLLVALLAAAPAAAADAVDVPLEDAQRRDTIGEKLMARERHQASVVADKYGVLGTDVSALRARGMGWGEVERTLDIALRADRAPAEIADLHEAGLGWDEVARRYGLAETSEKPPRDLRDAVKEPTPGRPEAGPKLPGPKAPARGRQGRPVAPKRGS